MSLIECQPILIQKLTEFLLKTDLLVMLLLPINVGNHSLQIPRADGKRPITFLATRSPVVQETAPSAILKFRFLPRK
jgi:hypothetical protein